MLDAQSEIGWIGKNGSQTGSRAMLSSKWGVGVAAEQKTYKSLPSRIFDAGGVRVDELCLCVLIKLPRNGFRSVVVLAHRTDAPQFSIEVRLAGADVANDLTKFADPVDVARFLQPRRVRMRPIGLSSSCNSILISWSLPTNWSRLPAI